MPSSSWRPAKWRWYSPLELRREGLGLRAVGGQVHGPTLGGDVRAPPAPAPTAATSSTCASTRSPTAAPGVARLDGYVVFVAARVPGDRVRARVAQVQARTSPRPARSRCSSPARTGSPPARRHPGAPWQVLPYERQLEVKQEPGRGRAAAHRPAGRLRARADRPRGRAAGATATRLEYSFGTGRRTATLVCGFHARGPLGAHRAVPTTACWPPSARTGCASAVRGLVPRRGPVRLRPPRRTRASCATSSSARAGAPGSSRRGSSPRPASCASRSSPAPSTADGVLWTRTDGVGGDDRAAARPSWSPASDDARGGARRGCASAISPDAFFQTNTEMAERLYGARRARRGAERASSASTTSTAGSARSALDARAARAARCGASRSSRRRSPTRSPTRALNEVENAQLLRRRRARWRCASWSSRPAGPTWSSSTRRAPACRRRSCAGSSRRRRSGSSTSPATRRRSRPTPRQLVEAGYVLAPGAPGRHVPADAAHRVRGAAGAGRDGPAQ